MKRMETDYGSIFKRFKWISSYSIPEHPLLLSLDQKMMQFYRWKASKNSYHLIAERGNVTWDNSPIHKAILEIIDPDEIIIEFSCGSGHASGHFLKRGCRYIGFDLSFDDIVRTKNKNEVLKLLVGNAYHTPIATSCADLTVSLYSLEHIVWPKKYLDEMLRVTRLGGHIILAFPEFVKDERHTLGSMRFGKSPGGIRDKIKKCLWLDAAQSIIEREVIYKSLLKIIKKDIYKNKEIKFLININPFCLVADFESDIDAIYLASEEEVAHYLSINGCSVRKRSQNIPMCPSSNAFIIAQVTKK